MNELKIEYVDIDTLKPYEKNAKLHPKEQVQQIKNSIEQFGMNDPIALWKDNTIIEGHGRLLACKELGIKEVPIIRLDNLSDEERKAYTLAHNKLTMNSDFDFDILDDELDDIINIDMSDFGFEIDLDKVDDIIDETYSKKIKIPQYEIRGIEPDIEELVDSYKADSYLELIENANVTDEQKNFLYKACKRLYEFDYSKIAEYYAHQNKEMQELMEKLALVIIDIDDAIANGYVQLSDTLEEIINDE